MTATHYRRSNGEEIEIATMEHTHLVASRDKLQREGDMSDPETDITVQAMTAQILVNEELFAERRAELEELGWLVFPVTYQGKTKMLDGFQAQFEGLTLEPTRNENGSWAAAWAELHPEDAPA